MIDPKEDSLSQFADWYLNSGDIKRIYAPHNDPLLFIDGVSGVVLYRRDNFQVELFICEPNVDIPVHTHPNVDSFELFLCGMEFTHNGKHAIDHEQSLEEIDGMPRYAYTTIRVRPNDPHGALSSKNGGSFLSIQHWLNGKPPTHVSSDWDGKTFMGESHKKQTGL
jgi:hypothetical protein